MKKKCSKCGDPKELDDLVKNQRCKNGRRGICKQCSNLYHRNNRHWLWREGNREKANIISSKWRKNNPKKAAKAMRNSVKKRVGNLTTNYVKSVICRCRPQISWKEITPIMVQIKREQIMVFRALKSLKETINE